MIYLSCIGVCLLLVPLIPTLSSIAISSAHASPVYFNGPAEKRETSKVGPLTITEEDEFFGIRQVPEEVAREYNKKKTLTQVRANGVNLGEGAYIAPQAVEQKFPLLGKKQPWQCILFINKKTIRDEKTPKFFLDESDIYLDESKEKINKHNVKVGHTVIFAYYNAPVLGMQAVIPPPFLEPTSLPEDYHYWSDSDEDEPKPGPGKNVLGLKVHYEYTKLSGEEAKIWKQVAKWEEMGIPGWPQGEKAFITFRPSANTATTAKTG
ncbi:hypothetical protein GYMLUDRAFT_251806 [Collybiopsis luxurians FD-317 M1]|uniref:Uncharacterized protein n=1 Tax=Collybiopsis luxurians FD-317 M1 TaxID=944289 RepID=A0A0D0BBJ5_9AGAR|nr:hypothetical protein GYMLUDRAFT_251806 [Collybiopsis luxurians FD-317 M1]